MTKVTKAKADKSKAADRRSFIKGAALAGAGATVAAASSFPAPAVAQKVHTAPRELDIVSSPPAIESVVPIKCTVVSVPLLPVSPQPLPEGRLTSCEPSPKNMLAETPIMGNPDM